MAYGPIAKKWHIRPKSPLAQKLAKNLGINSILAQVLINRGVRDEESARAFMFPRLADMPDPWLLPDMEKAVDLVCTSIANQDPITIYGDYDADGLTGACLLYHFFKDLGVPCAVYVPNRLKEGYGLNHEAVRKIRGAGQGLLITVDCGVSNEQEVALARELGMKVIVTDHHRIPKDIRFHCPVINPQRADSSYPGRELAGVGVAFLLAVGVRARLRERRYFGARAEPDMRDFLDLVAVGTVADQVPMLGQNRAFVKYGLSRLMSTRWPGLEALVESSGADTKDIDSTVVAFRIAPRLNAPGRISSPDICLRILMAEEKESVVQLATEINSVNALRQRLEQDVLRDIAGVIERNESILDKKVLVFGKEGWHEGVLGIVASRLVDKYYRPTLVLTFEGQKAKGSGRSIDKFNLYEAVCRIGDLLDRFGGHSHAAGFSLQRAKFNELKKTITEIAEESLGGEDLRPVLNIDAEVHFKEISRKLVDALDTLAPYGNGNPEPIFCTRSVQVLEARVVGEKHLKMLLREDGKLYDAIGFNMGPKIPRVGTYIDIAYTPELNSWQGYESIQLKLADFREHVP